MLNTIFTFISETLVGIPFHIIDLKCSNAILRFIAKAIIILFYLCIAGKISISLLFWLLSLVFSGETLIALGYFVSIATIVFFVLITAIVFRKNKK